MKRIVEYLVEVNLPNPTLPVAKGAHILGVRPYKGDVMFAVAEDSSNPVHARDVHFLRATYNAGAAWTAQFIGMVEVDGERLYVCVEMA